MNKILNVKFEDYSQEIVSPLKFEELIKICYEKFNNKFIFNCNCYLDNKELIDNNEKYINLILNKPENKLNIIFKNEKNYDLSLKMNEFLINKNKELTNEINILKNKFNDYQNNTIEDNNYYIGLSCKFLNKNSEKIIELDKIKEKNPIYHTFKIQNNGSEPFPPDTILKCDNTFDSDIFFFPVNIKFCLMNYDDNNKLYYNVEVIINFKSYKNIEEKTYEIRAYLVSDSKGRIGDQNNFCTFKLIVINNNINQLKYK